jgi:hypothetical protein
MFHLTPSSTLLKFIMVNNLLCRSVQQAPADNEYGWADEDKMLKEEKPYRKDTYKEDRRDNQVCHDTIVNYFQIEFIKLLTKTYFRCRHVFLGASR